MRRSRARGYLVASIGIAAAIAAGGAACSPVERNFPPLGGAGGAGGSGGGLVCTPDAVEPCYTGPEGSQGIGSCKEGTHVCNKDGTGFGACEGEVLPGAEDCTTDIDEACNDAPAMECAALGYVWSKAYGDLLGAQSLGDIAVTPDGDLVVVGGFAGMIDFGGQPLASTGSADIFVAKLKSTGEHIWSQRFGDANTQRATSVVVDPMGAIYVGGLVFGSVDFGDGVKTSAGSDDAFVAKFDPDGKVIWSKLYGDTASQEVKKLGLMKTNQVVMGGVFGGSFTFNNVSHGSLGGDDIFVAKLSSEGFEVNSRRYGGTGVDTLNGLEIDSLDAVLLTGGFDSTIDLVAGAPLTSAGAMDVFVAKLSPNLSTSWAKRWGDTDAQTGFDVAIGPGDEVMLAGSFKSTLEFGAANVLTTQDPAATNLYLARLSTNGDVSSAQSFGDATTTISGAKLAVDVVNGQLVVAGSFIGTFDFGGPPITGAAGADPFLAKLSLAGGHVASLSFPHDKGSQQLTPSNSVNTLALLPSGDPVIGGTLNAPVDFGGGAIGNDQGGGPLKIGGDAFVARFLH
ncbi:hypothetical protein [Polyangium aurulentum]|uniref:hypothetical protein n=1 Tax=Polyangium aurulentum TaxID=2567896 RepID=UPI0010AE9CDD|nr:hypothetical protein [Polyangium aurulentum]UQA61582.1 hypothetical protein E8A73_014360 [Polyangium aurulentum]